MTNKSAILKYEAVMEDFLSVVGWTDQLDIDGEAKTITLATSLSIAELNGRLIIEAQDSNDIFDFFIYFLINCKNNKKEQIELTLCYINANWLLGTFVLINQAGNYYVRWQHRVDFEGSSPSGITIKNNFQPGWNAVERYASLISAVALTNQSANEAIAEYEQEQLQNAAAESESIQEDDNHKATLLHDGSITEAPMTPIAVAPSNSFIITLGKTYYQKGFINPGLAASQLLGAHGEPVTVILGNSGKNILSRIDRTANANGSVRVIGKNSDIADWFQQNFHQGSTVTGVIEDQNTIRMLGSEEREEKPPTNL